MNDFLRKLRTTGSIERTVIKIVLLYVVLDLPDNVETQGEVINFVNAAIEYSFLLNSSANSVFVTLQFYSGAWNSGDRDFLEFRMGYAKARRIGVRGPLRYCKSSLNCSLKFNQRACCFTVCFARFKYGSVQPFAVPQYTAYKLLFQGVYHGQQGAASIFNHL